MSPPRDHDFAARLKEALGGQSIRSFARGAGFAHTTLKQYLSGKSEPTRPRLVAIASAAGVAVEWLATGRGPKSVGSRPELPSAAFVPIRAFDVSASAGGGAVIEDERRVEMMVSRKTLDALGAAPSDVVGLKATGDSMEPTLSERDQLLIDLRDASIPRDGVYVMRLPYGGELVVKRLQRLGDGSVKVISDNPSYEPFVLTQEQVAAAKVIGRVVAATRTM